MFVCDFEYDGRLLSDFGFIVCSFDDNGGADTSNTGSEINFRTVSTHSGKRFDTTGSEYEKCLSANIQICKDPKKYDGDNAVVTNEEFRNLSRWLNRREFLWFRSYDEDTWKPEMERAWFRASFTLSKIDVAGETYGIELTMTTDSPFGYGEEVEETVTFVSGSLSSTIVDYSDEIGEIYPEVDIECGQSGTLTLINSMTGCSFQVANCVSGEVLHLSGDSMIISTSSVSHDIANDFNYDFFSIGNTYDSRENTITASAPCTLTIRYRPLIKDTL